MQELITWTPALSVGVASMDGQHQRLIDLINELYRAMKVGQGSAMVGTVLEELVDYTITHFSQEERLMEQAGYAGLAAHREQHRVLTEQVEALRAKSREGRLGLSVEVLEFLKGWLIDHIEGTDKRYGPELSAHGIG